MATNRPRGVRRPLLVAVPVVLALVLANQVGLPPRIAAAATKQPEVASPADDAKAMHALTPARLMDTRSGATTIDGTNAGEGPVGANQSARLIRVRGRGGVPASRVGAVLLNVTATGATAALHLTLHGNGAAPGTSNLNVVPGQTIANSVLVRMPTDQNFFEDLVIETNVGKVHVIVDVVGWFPSGSDLTATAPARLLDSRPSAPTTDGQFSGTGAIGPQGTFALTVAGRGDVPASGAGAVLVNVTAVNPTTASHLTVFPSGTARPTASSLNFSAAETIPNLVIARIGADGKISLFNNAGSTHVIVDVFGWFPTGGAYHALEPARLLETRAGLTTIDGLQNGIGAIPGGQSIDLEPLGRGGVPSSGVGAVALNITVVAPTAASHLTVYPSAFPRPNASNINFPGGKTIANLVVARLGANGTVKIFNNSGAAHVVVDVVGWFPEVSYPPDGLTVQSVVSNLQNPWDIAFTPDGTLLYTERAGRVNAFVGGQKRQLAQPADLVQSGEGGMLGLAVDPLFASNRYLYTCFSSNISGPRDIRIVRWTVNAALTSLTNRADILTGIPTAQAPNTILHAGCRPRFGPDGYLWVTTGDAFTGTNPQDKQSLAGKVLRIDRDGNAAAGNPGGPFLAPIYTYGHRNPQGIAFRPSDGAAFSIEHGPDRDDEVNRLQAGGNYGWDPTPRSPGGPSYNQDVPMTDLVLHPDAIPAVWSSGSPTVACSGGTFVTGAQWKNWDGALLAGCLNGQQLRVFSIDPTTNVVSRDETTLRALARLRVAVQGPDGKLYLATDANPGQILRVTPFSFS